AGIFTGTAELIIDLRGNKTVTANNFVEPYTFLTDDGYEAVKNGNTYKQELIPVDAPTTVYVDPTGATEGSYTTIVRR
ncbi:MAG: hypothetical protein IJD11_02765, partial [Oscillospiraceae bacterium]|nr:hypothetical protein [Oscillospiraceae bacterium]